MMKVAKTFCGCHQPISNATSQRYMAHAPHGSHIHMGMDVGAPQKTSGNQNCEIVYL